MRRLARPLRRTALTGAVGALTTLLSVAVWATPASAATTAWRTDGYGPTNTGYNPVETAINTDNVEALGYEWSIVSPVVRNSCSRQTPPVVADNRLFLTDQAGFAAYNATTGARSWTFRDPRPAETNSALLSAVGNRVFAATTYCRSVSDPDSDLRVFNAGTGALQWQIRRDAPMFDVVVDKDVVLVSGEDVFAAQVTAYRVSDGTVLWEREAELVHPVSANGRVLINPVEGAAGSELVDIRTGTALWTSPTHYQVIAAGPAGGPLYARTPDGSLARVNVETGAQVWSVPAADGAVSTDGPRLYVARGTTLTARDSATGAELWSRGYAAPLGKPVIAGGVVYATVHRSHVEPLNATTGAVLDGIEPYNGAVNHPVVVNGRLYVTDGRVLDSFVP